MKLINLRKKKRNWIPLTQKRVEERIKSSIKDELKNKLEARVSAFSYAGSEAIEKRLKALDKEWDIERALMANASTLTLLGLGLGAFASRKWLVLPAVVASFCMQHAVQGWCPPIEAFRRMGLRTQKEIEQERNALKALRGDFHRVSKVSNGNIDRILDAVRK